MLTYSTFVENNFLSKGHPLEYVAKFKACNGDADCEHNVRKNMAKESAGNVQKLKSCWDAGDASCVADIRSKIELDEKAYTQLRLQDNMVGSAYESSAKWYADIIDQCAGKCGWLQAALLKTGADGLSNIAYAGLGAMNLPESDSIISPNSAAKNVPVRLERQTTSGLKLTADPEKTTTVLGTFRDDTEAIIKELGLPKSTDFGPKKGGFNLLNTPDDLYKNPTQF